MNRLPQLLLTSVVVLVATVLFVFNPSTTAFYPKCLFHELTGLYCPGCGTTRALHCLLHGDVSAALHANALATLAVPLLGGILLARAVRRRPPIIASRFAGSGLVVLLAVVVIFGALRNVPHRPFSLLAPPAADDKYASHGHRPMQ